MQEQWPTSGSKHGTNKPRVLRCFWLQKHLRDPSRTTQKCPQDAPKTHQDVPTTAPRRPQEPPPMRARRSKTVKKIKKIVKRGKHKQKLAVQKAPSLHWQDSAQHCKNFGRNCADKHCPSASCRLLLALLKCSQ